MYSSLEDMTADAHLVVVGRVVGIVTGLVSMVAKILIVTNGGGIPELFAVDACISGLNLLGTTSLALPVLRLACDPLIGEHDFSSFCRRPPDTEATMVRRVREATWRSVGEDVLCFEIEASAFCHQMVRSLVGTMVETGTGISGLSCVTGSQCLAIDDLGFVLSPTPTSSIGVDYYRIRTNGVIGTESAFTVAGTEITPPLGAVLSSVRVKVVSLWLLPAVSVPCAASEPVPLAVAQLIAVES